MQKNVQPKVKAALLRAERNLDEDESGSTPEMTSPSTNVGTAKKEAVALPRVEGTEKPGGSSFLGYPVWLRKWNQHDVDYKAIRETAYYDRVSLKMFEKEQWALVQSHLAKLKE